MSADTIKRGFFIWVWMLLFGVIFYGLVAAAFIAGGLQTGAAVLIAAIVLYLPFSWYVLGWASKRQH